jgi:hypothetical protein
LKIEARSVVTTPEVAATGVVTSFDPDVAWFRVALDRPGDADDDAWVGTLVVLKRTLIGTNTLVPGQRVEAVRTRRFWLSGAVQHELLQWRIAEQRGAN